MTKYKVWKWLLFMIWPFAAFIYAIRNFKYKAYRPVILAFFVLYGYTLIFNDSKMDANKNAKQFVEVASSPFSEFIVIFENVINRSTADLDLYKPLANFVVSRFTYRPQWVFALHAFVFGFFYLKSAGKLYDEFEGKFSRNGRIFFIFFVVLLPIFQINAVRMWTAVWVFAYGAINLFYGGSRKYIFLCLSAGLIHFSLFAVNAVFLLYYFLGNRNAIYIPLLVLSFLMPNALSEKAGDISSGLGEGFEQRTATYTNKQVSDARALEVAETRWFVRWKGKIITYFFLTAFVVTIINRKRFMYDQVQLNLISFLILFLSYVNFGSNIASFGGRMRLIFFLFSIFFFYRLYQINPEKKLDFVSGLAVFPVMLWAAVELRSASEIMGAFLFVSNPIVMLFTEPNLTVYGFLYNK